MMTLLTKFRSIRNSIKQNRFLHLIVSEWSDSQITFLSGGMAFFTILSLIPFLAVVFSIASLTGQFNISEVSDFILNYLAPRQANSFLAEIEEALSKLGDEYFGITGFALGFFVLAGLLRRLDKVVQAIWKTELRQSMWRTVAVFLVEIAVIIPIIIIAIATTMQILPLQRFTDEILIPYAVFFIMTYTVYRYLPRTTVSFADAIIPAVFASLCFIGGKSVYFWVTANLFNYNRIYGSLAALPLFLLWIYVLWLIFFTGVLATRLIRILRQGQY